MLSGYYVRRSLARKMLALVMVGAITLFGLPPIAIQAAAAPIGQLLTSDASFPAQAESTLFNGDTVQTDSTHRVAVTLKNAGLLNFGNSAQAKIDEQDGCYLVGLTKGEVQFASSKFGSEGLKIKTSNLEVAIPQSSAVSGKVLSTDRYILVSSIKGDILVANNGNSVTLNEGDTKVFPLAMNVAAPGLNQGPDNQPQNPDQDQNKNKKKKGGGAYTGAPAEGGGLWGLSKGATALIFLGIGVGATIGIHEAVESGEASPSRP